MSDTVISWRKKIDFNEPDQFIYTDLRGQPIGDTNITGVGRDAMDADDSDDNQAPQYTPNKFYAKEESEEEPAIPYPNIDLKINHKTPI